MNATKCIDGISLLYHFLFLGVNFTLLSIESVYLNYASALFDINDANSLSMPVATPKSTAFSQTAIGASRSIVFGATGLRDFYLNIFFNRVCGMAVAVYSAVEGSIHVIGQPVEETIASSLMVFPALA